MPTTTTELLPLSLHSNILVDIIKRQAGSLTKAILEGVMNSVDAGASRIDLDVSLDKVVITDDGRGFRSREEIRDWFGTFGTPHSEEERSYKTYGRFRMGRGQMFAFGRNVWRTGAFEMVVDIEREGLNYRLADAVDPVAGCRITIYLYRKLLPSDLLALERDLRQQVRYVAVPVFLNGKQISTDLSAEKWDVVTPEAYIRYSDSGGLGIFNLGVYTCELPGYHYGTGGVVVSRKELRVNFARNDIQSDCPVWQKIRRHLRRETTEKVRRTARKLTDSERQYLAECIKAGEHRGDLGKLKILTTVSGNHVSPDMVERECRRYALRAITVAPAGDLRGDKLMESRIAYVLSQESLDRFGFETLQELVDLMRSRRVWSYVGGHVKVTDFAQTASLLSEEYRIIPEAQWTRLEKILMDYLKYQQWRIAGWNSTRKLRLGESDVADAWTDGQTYIALHRKELKNPGTLHFWMRIGHLLLHEYCHDSSSVGSHVHGEDFFRAYHDRFESIADFVNTCIQGWPQTLEAAGRKVSKQALRFQDYAVRVERAMNHYETAVAQIHQGNST